VVHNKHHFIRERSALDLKMQQRVGLDIIPISDGFCPNESFEVHIGVLANGLKFFIDALEKFGWWWLVHKSVKAILTCCEEKPYADDFAPCKGEHFFISCYGDRRNSAPYKE
jgi:hypothetical protein